MHIGIVSHVSTAQLSAYLNLKGGEPNGTDGATAPNLLIIELLKRGYYISVFSLTNDLDEGHEYTVSGASLTIYFGAYQKRVRNRALSFFKKERRFLRGKILEVKPDILHAHWQYEYAWAALESGIKTVVTCRDSPIRVFLLYRNFYRFIRLCMAYLVLRKATVVTATSFYLARDIQKLGIKAKVNVIPNFEPDWLFETSVLEKDLSNPRIIMINNGFDNRKNVKKGIEAFQILRNDYPRAELHLYGHGYDEDGQAALWSRQNGLDKNVYFKGYKNFVDLMRELRTFTILVHPSKEETFGNILTESMALGIPVVGGLRSGSVPWVVGLDQKGGVLTDITSSKAIGQSMINIICNEDKYRNYVEQARTHAMENFSAQKVVDLYINLYK